MKTINSFRSKLFALILALVASVATFAYDFQEDGLFYTILPDGESVAVTCERIGKPYTDIPSNLVIPEKVFNNHKRYYVTEIDNHAFQSCEVIESVVIPNTVTKIGETAFMYCKSLKSIEIPNSVISIGAHAFSCCYGLDYVVLGNGLTDIADNTFYECSALKQLIIPNSVISIGKHAFFSCDSLKTIDIPNTVTTIGDYAFSGCSKLESIYIPYGVSKIGVYTFENCSSLKYIFLPQSITSIGHNAFSGCAELPAIDIPEGIKSIAGGTFANCTSLASITIPNNVMAIELGAFSNTAYYNDAKNWDKGVLYISNCLIEAKTSITGNYSIKPNTRIIADYALYGCSNLTSVTFPQSVKSIGDASFYECKKMNEVNMSDSLQNIGNRAFAYCELLNPVTIPVGVKTFGEEVFMGCKSLVSVIWNAKECQDFPYFYMAPFYRISSKITSITFGDEVEYIPAGMCYGLSAVPSVTIPVNVKRIGKDAFESCTSMTSITWNAKHYCDTLDYPPFEGIEYIVKSFTFGEGIETIPPYVCKEMREVSEIIIPDGVISIGRHAFNYCTSIQSINIPKGVTTIGSAAFFHTQISSVVVPEGVTEIGGWAFSECYGLNKIELPRSLKSIGNSAFKETYHIDTLICKAGVPPTMGELAVFEGVKKANISLFVPKESIELYKAADQWKEFEQILAIPTVTPEDLFPTLWGLHRTDIEVHTTQTNTSHLTCFDEYIHYVPDNKLRVYLTYDRLTYLREENNQVLLYAPSYGINEDVVLYDWTLEVGDTLPVMLYDEKTRGEMFRVVGVSLVTLLDGKEYKKWTLACGIEYIEGIGAINGDGYGNYLCLQHSSHPATYIGSPLVCASRNGQLLYQMDEVEMERLGAECLCEVETSYKSQWCNKWNVMWFDGWFFDETASTSQYRLGKDTIIGDYTYSKFNARTYVRFTEDRKVYVYYEGFDDNDPYTVDLPTGEYLAYDFSAQVGDTLEVFSGVHSYSKYKCLVHEVQTDPETKFRTITLFQFLLEDTDGDGVEEEYGRGEITWLEGVGSPNGFLINTPPPGGGTYALLCAYKDDELKYTGDLYDEYGCEYNAGPFNEKLLGTWRVVGGNEIISISDSIIVFIGLTQKYTASATQLTVERLWIPEEESYRWANCNYTLSNDTLWIDNFMPLLVATYPPTFGPITLVKVKHEDLFPTLWGLQRTGCTKTIGENENGTVWGSRSYLMQEIQTTTIDGKLYIVFGDEYDRFALREENNKILVYSSILKKDLVLYDFTLEVGDSLPALYFEWRAHDTMQQWLYNGDIVDYNKDDDGTILPAETFVVTDISTITLLDGKEYKKWTFDNGMEYVEGIGSFGTSYAWNDFYQLIANGPLYSDVFSQHLVCASKNGQLLYLMDDVERERLGAKCLCDIYLNDNAKNGKIGGRPTPTQWYVLDIETKDMGDPRPTVLRAETFSYTLENDSIVANNKTFYQLACQSTKDTATTKSVVGAIHFSEDEGNRVYFLCDGEEYVLYDFTAEPGDTVEIFAGINNYPQETTYTHVVIDKDTLENGACRMFLEVVFPDESNTGENTEKVWLAGLGSIDGIVHNTATRTTKARSGDTQTTIMLCAWREDSCLYMTDHPDYDTLGCVYNIDEMTAIEDIHTFPSYQKILRDGQLFIIHEGKTYNVMGIAVE